MIQLFLRPWKLYAGASGRSTRSEFWLFFAIKYGVLLLLFAAAGGLSSTESGNAEPLSEVPLILLFVWILGTFLPSVVLLVRRCHDFDATGKWALTTFVPYVGVLAVIAIGTIPGTRGENERGFDPREREPDTDSLAQVFE